MVTAAHRAAPMTNGRRDAITALSLSRNNTVGKLDNCNMMPEPSLSIAPEDVYIVIYL